LGAVVPAALHDDEIPLDVALVRTLVRRAMPEHADLPVRRLPSTGSTNALFRLGDELVVRLPRQPGGSATIAKEARWLPVVGPSLPVAVPEVLAVFEPDAGYPEHWSVTAWIEGRHPDVVEPGHPPDPARVGLARDLATVVRALSALRPPAGALADADLRWYRAEPLRTMDETTRSNIARLRALDDVDLDLDAVERVWDDAMRLPDVVPAAPRWCHADLAAENLLMLDGRLSAVLDFGGLCVGDPTVDLAVAWEVLDEPAREVFRTSLGVDDATWLRSRAWALCISTMIWYYWSTLPGRRASRMAVCRNVLADAGFRV
jgi:aminoglycoside phosphotransferase (APT) family kinase protein